MARAELRFREADLKRAWNAAEKYGLDIVRTEISKDGTIVIVHKGEPTEDDLDAELRKWRHDNERNL